MEGVRVDGQMDQPGVEKGGCYEPPELPLQNIHVDLRGQIHKPEEWVRRNLDCIIPILLHTAPLTLAPQSVNAPFESHCSSRQAQLTTKSTSVARLFAWPNSKAPAFRRALSLLSCHFFLQCKWKYNSQTMFLVACVCV